MGFTAAEISLNLLATNCPPPPARSSPPQKSAPAPACRAGSVCVDSETWHKAATRPRSRGGVWVQHRHHHHHKATHAHTHARTRARAHARTHARTRRPGERAGAPFVCSSAGRRGRPGSPGTPRGPPPRSAPAPPGAPRSSCPPGACRRGEEERRNRWAGRPARVRRVGRNVRPGSRRAGLALPDQACSRARAAHSFRPCLVTSLPLIKFVRPSVRPSVRQSASAPCLHLRPPLPLRTPSGAAPLGREAQNPHHRCLETTLSNPATSSVGGHSPQAGICWGAGPAVA